MLEIYDVVLVMAGDAARIAGLIERKDRDLARQMRRAMQSVALNVAEAVESFRLKKR
ncbi:four helix bundle protein [Polyangium sp. 15x6]|uniref:four helix bundle protein n=1 Tax=Polyangium sp. 15x6 TaxID=3042687 RepID=UPI00249ADCD0|nr:four helix bundle protein [Polyangium sp. 15x6]MDI3282313.1 four helix bundle protein [Polyangium sp. 15x6]